MKKLTLVSLFTILAFLVQAQQISGKLVDATNTPIDAATIILQTLDSTYVDVAYSDTLGNFIINDNLSDYQLIVQHLLYDSYHETFSSPDVGVITMKNKDFNLSEVVVKGERPLVKVINGKMTYDMPQLLKDKMASNAYDAILELPGVYEQNELLNLAGSNGVNVIINGKPSTMSNDQLVTLLKNIPKERIQLVEVMYNAPPQYHIRGAVINLILTGTSETPRLQGQVSAKYSQYHYANYGSGATLMYSTPKFSADFMYSFNYLNDYSGLDLESFHLFEGKTHAIQQSNQGQSKNGTHSFRLGNDYFFNPENKLSLVYTNQIKAWSHGVQLSEGSFSNSENRKNTDNPIQMHNVTLDYTSGFGLNVGMDYTFFKSSSTQDNKEKMVGKEDSFSTQTKQKINRFFFYADQSHLLTNDWTLDYGISFNYASDKSSQLYDALNDKELSKQNTMSNLNEYTYELYAGFSKEFSDKLSLRASLTGEYYKYKDKDYLSIYPELEMTYTMNPKHILQYGLGVDKSYPSYWEMTNAVSYMDGYTEIHGNPNLKPYKSYTMQLSYILKSKYIFTLYGVYQDDYFVQLPYQAADRLALIYKTTNFDYKTEIGVNGVIPFRIGSVLDSRLALNAYYDKVKSSDFNNLSFYEDNFAILVQLSNTFNISSKPNIKAELLGLYTTRNIQGPSTLSSMYKVDAGIKWTSENNKAEIRLKVDDLFNSWSPKNWRMKFENQNLNMHLVPDNRSVTLSFTYKFGDYKKSNRKEIDTSRFGTN